MQKLLKRNKTRNTLLAAGAIVAATAAGHAMSQGNTISANADQVSTNNTNNSDTYTIKTGDTLSEIAQSKNVDLNTLYSNNGLTKDSVIKPGDTIKLTGTNTTDDKTYTVKSGDTLFKIAQAKGISLNDLFTLNGKSETNSIIYPGDVIKLKADTATTSTNTQTQATSQAAPIVQNSTTASTSTAASNVKTSTTANSGSSYDQFKAVMSANGVSDSEAEQVWNQIVMPESSGNVNATNGQYHGMFQGTTAADYSSDATAQTQQFLKYVSRYGGIQGTLSFRAAHNWY